MRKLFFLIMVVSYIGCSRNPSRLTLSGTLELTEHAIGPKTAGRLTTITIEEGDYVKEGQLIGTLERYDQAKRDYDRISKLFEHGGATQQMVEQASLTLDDQSVVSPVDGIVLTKIHEAGEIIGAGSAIAVIGEHSHPWVRIYVPEGLVSRIYLQQRATLRFDGLNEDFAGHVIFVAPKAEFTPRNVQTKEERVTQTFAVKVALDKPIPSLRPGVSADVTIELQGDRS